MRGRLLGRLADPESRAVHQNELDAMISLMCEAFVLPLDRARDLFYKDPYFDISKKRVLVDRGEVVSCLTIVDTPMRIGRAVVRVGGIAGVATRQRQRRRGHASRLLAATLPVLREQGYALSALYALRPCYYRRLGWEIAGTQIRIRLRPSDLVRYSDTQWVRTAVRADIPAMARLYDAYSAERTGFRVRDTKRWTYLVDHVQSPLVYVHADTEGYALSNVHQDEAGRELHVVELVAETERAARGLLGHVARHDGVEAVVHCAAVRDESVSAFLNATTPEVQPEIEAIPGPMFRVVDFAGALRELSPNFAGFDGCVTLISEDDRAPDGACRFASIRGDGATVSVEPQASRSVGRNVITGDTRTWAQVLAGHLSLADAVALERLLPQPASTAEVAAPLFPRRDPFIPVVDHF